MVLTGWAFDRPGWRRGIAWERESMERYVDARSHCTFAQGAGRVSCRLSGAAAEGLEWMWAIEAEGDDEATAYAEWLTQSAVAANTAPPEARQAWGRLLGTWVVAGKARASTLTQEQRTRIDASSPSSWTGAAEDSGGGGRESNPPGRDPRPHRF